MELEKIKQKTVVEQVMMKIKELISTGQLKAGDKLPTENELAETFGIGRSSIREAIKIFQYLGILSPQVAKGTFVCERSNISTEAITWSILLGQEEMYEIIELREIIERKGLEELLKKQIRGEKLAEEVLRDLEVVLSNIKKAAAENSVQDFINLDYRFHEPIISGSGNSLFLSIYHTLKAFMYEEIVKSILPGNLMRNYAEHLSIFKALKKANLDLVLLEHSKHIESIRNNISNLSPNKKPAGI